MKSRRGILNIVVLLVLSSFRPASAQEGKITVFEAKIAEELRLLSDWKIPYGRGGINQSRGLRMMSDAGSLIFTVSRNSEKDRLLADVSVSSYYKIGREPLGGSQERKNYWVDLPGLPQLDKLTDTDLTKILDILKSANMKIEKETFIKRGPEGSVFLYSKSMSFSVEDSQIALLKQMIGVYFSSVDFDKVSFERRTPVIE